MDLLGAKDLEWNKIVPTYARAFTLINFLLKGEDQTIIEYKVTEVHQFEDACSNNDIVSAADAVNKLIEFLNNGCKE